MRRLFTGLVLLSLVVTGCGKSRLSGDGPSGTGWDEPTAANGFHGDSNTACSNACVPKAEAEPRKHPIRTSPEARVVATLAEPSLVGLVHYEDCIHGSSIRDFESGGSWCMRPRRKTMGPTLGHGTPSAMVATADRLYVATRDANGRSTVRQDNTIVSAGETEVRALAARGDEVCWIEANERVRCARGADPVSVETVAHAPALDARFLAMDDDAFYVVRGGWIAL